MTVGIGLGGMLGGGLAGGAGVNKFEPVPGNDTVNKNGITHTVSTKLHCISAMKQYEQSKISLEVSEHALLNRAGLV